MRVSRVSCLRRECFSAYTISISPRNLCLAVLTTLSLSVAGSALAYPPPEPDPDMPVSDVQPAVQQLRRDMLDAGINVLTFRSMDRIFTTRTVARSGPVWKLPHADHELNFTYQYQGKTYTPQ